MKELSKRVEGFTESVIREMTRKCEAKGALNLAQGFPDFDPPTSVKNGAAQAIERGLNQYSTTHGILPLRKAIAEKMRSYNQIDCTPEDNITVTCGTTEAMMAALMSLLDPGEEVVILEPFYENYGPDTILSGSKCRYVPLEEPKFRLEEETLKKAFTRKTKAIILNTPHNPTGHVFDREELRVITDLCRDYDAYAITDEVYEYMLYDGKKHVSIGSMDGMHDRTVTISGFSKTYSMTGWRIGYIVAEKPLTSAIRKTHDFLTVCAPTPLQYGCLRAMKLPQSYYRSLVEKYAKSRELLLKVLTSIGFECVTPQGAYYVWTKIDGTGFTDDRKLAEYLINEVGVGGVPGSSFYHKGTMGRRRLRFSFSKNPSTIREAAGRLSKMRRNS